MGLNSGLKGVDLFSFPLLKTWIEDSVNISLLHYVKPQYISVDMTALLASTHNKQEYVCPNLNILFSYTISSDVIMNVNGC